MPEIGSSGLILAFLSSTIDGTPRAPFGHDMENRTLADCSNRTVQNARRSVAASRREAFDRATPHWPSTRRMPGTGVKRTKRIEDLIDGDRYAAKASFQAVVVMYGRPPLGKGFLGV
jgi:hypothetical protein